jgi:hypothetical protein
MKLVADHVPHLQRIRRATRADVIRGQGIQERLVVRVRAPDVRRRPALETGETGGFMKAIVDADTGQILCCAVLGGAGGEIMTMIQVAMLGKLTYTAMADAIFTQPLLAEGLNTLLARCLIPKAVDCPAVGRRGASRRESTTTDQAAECL